jgi:hypothetical protein
MISPPLSLSFTNAPQKPSEFHYSSQLLEKEHITKGEGTKAKSKQSVMILPFFIHSTNIWSVPTVHTAVLRTVGNISPFRESAFRKKKRVCQAPRRD